MLRVRFDRFDPPVRQVLCLGAHCDDLEIGCGGTVLTLAGSPTPPAFTWVVFTSDPTREAEALRAAETLLAGTPSARIIIKKFRDGFLPYEGALVKEAFEELKGLVSPDLILTHYRDDLHQDHRLISELTWNTFRDHFILEYEVPKWDGDLGSANLYVPLSAANAEAKVAHILAAFPSQAGRDWFSESTFRAVLRLRGIECRAADGQAEAFVCRKLVV
jgi:LmbE family N-acetylglucosaminyl deacetylase